MLISIARRPLWQRRGCCNNNLISLMRSWTQPESLKMLSTAMRCLNQVTKGIFLHSFAKVKGCFTLVKHCIRTPVHFHTSFRQSDIRSIRSALTLEYSVTWHVVVVFVTFRPQPSPSLLQLCENTRRHLARPREPAACPCHLLQFRDFAGVTYAGHSVKGLMFWVIVGLRHGTRGRGLHLLLLQCYSLPAAFGTMECFKHKA